MFIALSIVIWSSIAYAFEEKLIELILKPAGDQEFIYTSPGGGLDFIVRVTLYAGLILSFPVIIYNIIRFLQPILKNATRLALWCSAISAVLALFGIWFGYFFVLPSALNFLLSQLPAEQIKPLLTIQAYTSFVVKLLFGTAILFQTPLIIYLVNCIAMLSARKLVSLKVEKWVVVISFTLAAIVNPSPRWQDMLFLAVPMLLSYHIGVIVVWYSNRFSPRRPQVRVLNSQDEAKRLERENMRQQAIPLFRSNKESANEVTTSESL